MERDRSRAVETVIAVKFRAEVCRIRYLRTDAPLGLISSLTHKGQVFVFGILCAVLSLGFFIIQRIVTFAKHDDIAACSCGNSGFQGVILRVTDFYLGSSQLRLPFFRGRSPDSGHFRFRVRCFSLSKGCCGQKPEHQHKRHQR